MHAPAVDHRTPTHDGYIWPVTRSLMAEPGAMRQRMAEDIATLVDDRGEDACVDAADLVRMGWRPEQVRAYSSAALSTLPTRRPSRRRSRTAGEIAATLACFAVPAMLLTRQILGV